MPALVRFWPAAALAVSAAACAGLCGGRAFSRLVRRDVEALRAQSSAGRPAVVITEEMLSEFPEPVRRYLVRTGVVGHAIPGLVRLRQTGRMRLGAGQPWIPVVAEEHYCVDPPGFVWAGTMRLGPVRLARARDMYLGGHGRMLVKLASLLPVADASGEQMDQGAMMRYLSEMIFFPAAFVRDNISFHAVNDLSARVSLSDHGRTVTGTLHFDREGRLTDFTAMRYRTVGGRQVLTAWSTPATAYGIYEGLALPVRGRAVWQLPDGDLDYIDVTATDIRYA
jgi:hypothetical protein